MMPGEIAQALDDMKATYRIDEWFVYDYGADQPREWFIKLSGMEAIQYNRREVEAFLLGASLLE